MKIAINTYHIMICSIKIELESCTITKTSRSSWDLGYRCVLVVSGPPWHKKKQRPRRETRVRSSFASKASSTGGTRPLDNHVSCLR